MLKVKLTTTNLGVFKDDELMYVIELNGFKIVQAKGVFNFAIPDKVMNVIDS